AGERPARLEVEVLRRERDRAAPQRLSRRVERREDGREHDLARGGLGFELRAQLARERARLVGEQVHLEIAGDDGPPRHRSASTPGSFRPSRNSSDAPPPVETWPNEDARPARLTAATLSPPPTTEKAELAAMARAMPNVP